MTAAVDRYSLYRDLRYKTVKACVRNDDVAATAEDEYRYVFSSSEIERINDIFFSLTPNEIVCRAADLEGRQWSKYYVFADIQIGRVKVDVLVKTIAASALCKRRGRNLFNVQAGYPRCIAPPVSRSRRSASWFAPSRRSCE